MFERVVLDIETNNLLSPLLDYTSMPFKLKEEARLWCIVLRCMDTEKSLVFINPDYIDYEAPTTKLVTNTYTDPNGEIRVIEETVTDHIGIAYNKMKKYPISKEYIKRALKNCKELIAHNGILFDFPMLQLFDIIEYKVGYPGQSSTLFGNDVLITDTLLWSKMLNPDRYDVYGRHALAAWGQRVGAPKMDFHAFDTYSGHMVVYCDNDTLVSGHVHTALLKEKGSWSGWDLPYSMDSKLADLTLRQELFGFEFDVELGKRCVQELNGKMDKIRSEVNPILPPKMLNKGDQKEYTLPKKQFKADGTLSAIMLKFIERLGAEINDDNLLTFEGREYKLPAEGCIKETLEADIDDLNHLKSYLLSLEWDPIEWKERDLTKDSKKQKLDPIKLQETIERYVDNTLTGPFKDARLKILEVSEDKLLESLKKASKTGRPIRVPVSPCIRVGTDKEICPNLVSLGGKAEFAKSVTEYFTFKHRKNSIAGGKEDEEGEPMTGYLSLVRPDGRIATPADTLAASTSRYKHRNVVNIPRVTSLYGHNMRALFRAGHGFDQVGFDFASLEARINGHYVIPYTDGKSLAAALVAEKPNDIHTLNAIKLGIDRNSAKSFSYATMYGAQVGKLAKMLRIDTEEAERLFEAYWEAVPALRELKQKVEQYWIATDKQYILGIDGRKLFARSQHSLVNLLFQGAGAIMCKWSIVYISQILENQNLLGDPLIHKQSDKKIFQMIVNHDEVQYAAYKGFLKTHYFGSKEETEQYEKYFETLTKEEKKNSKHPALVKAKEYAKMLNNPSAIGYTDDGVYYVTEENILSKAIVDGIDQAVKQFKLKVELGMEWITGENWAQCH